MPESDKGDDDGKTGILVSKENPNEIAAAINNLLSDEGMAEKLGSKARQKAVEDFSWRVVAKKTEAIYKQVVLGI